MGDYTIRQIRGKTSMARFIFSPLFMQKKRFPLLALKLPPPPPPPPPPPFCVNLLPFLRPLFKSFWQTHSLRERRRKRRRRRFLVSSEWSTTFFDHRERERETLCCGLWNFVIYVFFKKRENCHWHQFIRAPCNSTNENGQLPITFGHSFQ